MGEVAARGVHNPFWLACGARGIQQKQQLLSVHWFGNAHVISLGHEFVIPVIATTLHRHFIVATLHHNDMLDCCRQFDCIICLVLEWKYFTSSPTAISSDQYFCFSIINAVG